MTEISRRQVVRLAGGAGTLGVALPLLAACGSSDTAASEPAGPATTSGSTTSGSTASSSTGAVAGVVATADVPVGSGVILASANLVVTQPAKGTFKVFSATCTHAGCPVGSISGTTITCPCHGSEFSTTDGSVIQGPAAAPLSPVAFEVLKGQIVPELK